MSALYILFGLCGFGVITLGLWLWWSGALSTKEPERPDHFDSHEHPD